MLCFHSLVRHPAVPAGAPVPKGADAVVQIENTEQLPERQDGEKRIKIVKVWFIAHVFSHISWLWSHQDC